MLINYRCFRLYAFSNTLPGAPAGRRLKKSPPGRRRGLFAMLFFILSVFSTSAGIAASDNREIVVSAAVSLKNAFEEIGMLYEKQSGIRVRLNLGASGLLQKQIEAGAPADIFASASVKQMDALQSQGLIVTNTRRIFVRNTLVLITPSNTQIRIRSFQDLAQPEVVRIAMGSPKTVPAGQYAEEILRNLKLWDRVQPRLIYGENVRQVLDYVARGEVDAGLVYASDTLVAAGKIQVAAQAPKEAGPSINYPVAAVQGTGNLQAARRFIELLMAPTGQAILKKHGFLGAK